MKKHLVLPTILAFFFLLLFTGMLQAQDATFRGKVTDVNNNPLPGVNVIQRGTGNGTVTDTDGRFVLDVPLHSVIVFTYIGFTSLEYRYDGIDNVTIVLHEDSRLLGEVVVTTQKRAQSNIEVPTAVSAISGSNLKNLHLQQLNEAAEFIPGVQIQIQSPNNPGYVIRGVTSDDGDSRSQPRISVFQDGVSISRSRASVVELFDLERIEVVKGPQGTLFGRGAEIGAIHILRNKPVDYFTGEVSLKYGTYNTRNVTGFINTPLIDRKLATRFAFTYDARDGFIENLSGGKLNGKSAIALRNSTRMTFSEKLTGDLILDYQYDDYPGTSFKSKRYAPKGGDTDPNTAADLEQGKNLYIKRHLGGGTFLLDYDMNTNWKMSSITGFRAFDSDESFDADGTVAPILWISEIAKGNQFSQEFRFNYDNHRDFSGFVGASYFYENSRQEVPMRINEQALYPAYISPVLKQQFATQLKDLPVTLTEPILNLLFPDQPVVEDGVFKPVEKMPDIRQTLENVFSQQVGIPVTLEQALASMGIPQEQIATLVTQIDAMSNQPIHSYHEEGYTNYGVNQAAEVFADGTFRIVDNLSLTAGFRLSYEHQQGGYKADASEQPSIFGMMMNGTPNLMNPISDGKITAEKDYFSWVGRVALNYMLKRNNFYLSASKGRRPGVILVLPSAVTYLQPEIIYSYEAGVKGLLAGGKLGYEVSAYYYDWNHFQTTSLQTVEGSLAPQYLADDAGKAHTFGMEASLNYAPVNGLNLFGKLYLYRR